MHISEPHEHSSCSCTTETAHLHCWCSLSATVALIKEGLRHARQPNDVGGVRPLLGSDRHHHPLLERVRPPLVANLVLPVRHVVASLNQHPTHRQGLVDDCVLAR